VFVEPTLGNLLERSWVEIMEFFSASPKRDNEIGFDEQTKVFRDALPGHAEMAAKLVQSLAVILVELIQQGPALSVGESFEDFVHGD